MQERAAAAARQLPSASPVQLMRAACLAVLLLLAAPGSTNASEGDEALPYRACHAACLTSGCAQLPGSHTKDCAIACPGSGNSCQPPLALRLTQWDCSADCGYHCMWAAEAARAAAAAAPAAASHGARPYKVWKYGGKWPFVRVLGAQEIASVLFSLANLLAHAHCLRRLLIKHAALSARAATNTGSNGSTLGGGSSASGYPYLWAWVLYAVASMNAWLWSCVFHTRDTRVTERLDYLVGANFLVAATSFITAARVLGLTKPRQLGIAAGIVGAALLHHHHYMLFVKFDYEWNMKVCVAAGVVQGLAWLAWVMRVCHPARHVMYLFLVAVHLAMLLEVLDFPPFWRLLDAHALWHAATAPLTYVWYRFVAADMAWLPDGGCAAAAKDVGGKGAGVGGAYGGNGKASPQRGKKEKQ